MLAYAPRPDRRRFSPAALTLIVGAHAVAIVALMSAKMDVIRHGIPPTIIELIPNQPPPEPPRPQPRAPNAPPKTTYSAPNPIIDPPPMPGPTADPLPPMPNPIIGPDVAPPTPRLDPPLIRTGPRFITPAEDVRPPYPDAMRAQEKEAVLRLRLAIDARGRVVAVDPVGKSDPAFLAAARRHILKAWRYTPAMEGDHAIVSTTVITLEFRLD